MRRVSLLMVFAVAAFMSLGTTGAMAAGKAGAKPTGCKYGKGKGKNGCKPKPQLRDCKYGKDIKGNCKLEPPQCPNGTDKDGNCLPKPPIVVPPPKEGACSLADLVLLEDLLKGTGALLCVYLGDNAPNATADLDCPDAVLALPLDNLVGACLYLPPAEVPPSASTASPASASQLSAIDAETSSVGGLQGLVSTLTGLLKLG
jgi:hypothetical protein